MADWLDSHLIIGTLIPFLIFILVVGVISLIQCGKFRANRRSERAAEEVAEAYETIREKQLQGMAEAQDFVPQVPGRPNEAERVAMPPSPDVLPNMPAPMHGAERDLPRRLDSISDANSNERLLLSNASSPEPEPSHMPVQTITLEPEPVTISPSGSTEHNSVLQKLAEKKEHDRKEAVEEMSQFQMDQQRFKERQLDLERQDDQQRDREQQQKGPPSQQWPAAISPLDPQIPPAPPLPEDSNTPRNHHAPAAAAVPVIEEQTAQLKKELPPSYNPGLMDLPMQSAIVPIHPPPPAPSAAGPAPGPGETYARPPPAPENVVTYHRPPVLVSPEPNPNPDSTVSSIRPEPQSQAEDSGSPRIPTLEFALSSRENRILQNLEQLERNDRARSGQTRPPRDQDPGGMRGRVSTRFDARGAGRQPDPRNPGGNPIPDFFGYSSPGGQAGPTPPGHPTPPQPNKSGDAQWLDSMRSLRPWSGTTAESSPMTSGQHSNQQGQHPHRSVPRGPMIFPANPPPKPQNYPRQYSGQVASGDVIPHNLKSPSAPAGHAGQGLGQTDPSANGSTRHQFGMVRPQSGPMDPRRVRERQEQQQHQQQASFAPRTDVWGGQQQQVASF